MMNRVSVRALRNHARRVLKRVANGESITVTLYGEPVAQLRPIPSSGVPATELLRRWRRLPVFDGTAVRADIDPIINTAL